jgi:transposase-like protein
MPRDVTVTLSNGERLQYNGVPDDVTPDQITERAQQEGGADVVEIDGGAAAMQANATPAAATIPVETAPAVDGRKAFESEVRDYYSGLKGAPLDTSKLTQLGEKYLGGAPTNIAEIEDFYKKYGTLDPRLRDLTPAAAPTPPAKPEDIITTVPRASDDVQMARAFGKGLLSNFADELEAAGRTVASGEMSVDEYYRVKDQINADYNAFAKANPGLALSGELSGGVAQMFIPGLNVAGKAFQGASGLGRAVLTGGASGALSGLGEAETFAPSDIIPSVLEEGTIGAVGGGVLGKATELAGRAAIPTLAKMRGKYVPPAEQRRAAEMLYSATEGGASPERAARLSRLAQLYGVPTPLGMTTPELANLSKIVMTRAPLRERTLATKLAETQEPEAVVGRIEGQIEKAFPDAKDYTRAEDSLTNTLRANADTRYDAAYAAAPEIRDPRVIKLLDDPDIRSAYVDALKSSRRQQASAIARGEDPEKYKLKELFEAVIDDSGDVVGVRGTGKVIPDLKTLDQMKRTLDARARAAYMSGDPGAESLGELRKSYVNLLDEVGPKEYKAARAQYAGDKEVLEALEYGRDLVGKNIRPEQVRKFMSELSSDAERDALRNGVFEGLIVPLQTTTTSRNFAREIVRNQRKMEKLEAILPPAEFKFLSKALEKERQLFERISTARGGSQTVPLAEAVREFDEIMAGGNIDNVVNFLTAGPQGKFLALANFVNKFNPQREFGEKVYTQLSKALSADTPEKLRDVLSMLRNSASYAQSARAVSKAATGEIAAVTGNVAPSMFEDRGVNPPPLPTIGAPETKGTEETMREVNEALYGVEPEESPGLSAVPPEVANAGTVPLGSSLGDRNMNRGNLKDFPWVRKQPGYVGPGEGGFAQFESVEAGDAAQMKLVGNKFSSGARTVASLIDSYLGGDPANKPAEIRNYKGYVAKQLGLSPSDAITADMLPMVSRAMIEFETGATR